MSRNIFIVNAQIVDANGAYHVMDGYPKPFDSNNYQNDVDKAKKRAEGDMSEQWSKMCLRDDRMIQMVSLVDVFGNLIEKKSMGDFPKDPEPEPNAE